MFRFKFLSAPKENLATLSFPSVYPLSQINGNRLLPQNVALTPTMVKIKCYRGGGFEKLSSKRSECSRPIHLDLLKTTYLAIEKDCNAILQSSRHDELTKRRVPLYALQKVIVHFSNTSFSGASYGLTLALADKLARFQSIHPFEHIYATGVIKREDHGKVTVVDSFEEKLDLLLTIGAPNRLFLYPKSNEDRFTDSVREKLKALEQMGVRLLAVDHIEQLDGVLWKNRAIQRDPLKNLRRVYKIVIFLLAFFCLLFLSRSMTERFSQYKPVKIERSNGCELYRDYCLKLALSLKSLYLGKIQLDNIDLKIKTLDAKIKNGLRSMELSQKLEQANQVKKELPKERFYSKACYNNLIYNPTAREIQSTIEINTSANARNLEPLKLYLYLDGFDIHSLSQEENSLQIEKEITANQTIRLSVLLIDAKEIEKITVALSINYKSDLTIAEEWSLADQLCKIANIISGEERIY